jgi:hypothetical protein
MRELSLPELETLTDIAACFDYNRTFLQEIVRDFVDSLVDNWQSSYISSKSSSPDTLVFLYSGLRAKCAELLKNEIAQLSKETRKLEKRPYRHIAYLHAIGICGFSYSDEYDVYYQYFKTNFSDWKDKNNITDAQRQMIIRRFIPRKLDGGENIVADNFSGDIANAIKKFNRFDYSCKEEISTWLFIWKTENLYLLLPDEKNDDIKEKDVLCLSKKVKNYLNEIGVPKVLDKIKSRPDIYLSLALLANYIIFRKPFREIDVSMLALCIIGYENFKNNDFKLHEPNSHVFQTPR